MNVSSVRLHVCIQFLTIPVFFFFNVALLECNYLFLYPNYFISLYVFHHSPVLYIRNTDSKHCELTVHTEVVTVTKLSNWYFAPV